MRNFLLVVLALAAVGYYFDISPTDFLPTVQSTDPDFAKAAARNAARPPAPPAQPQTTATSTPVTNKSDGSLANRWKP